MKYKDISYVTLANGSCSKYFEVTKLGVVEKKENIFHGIVEHCMRNFSINELREIRAILNLAINGNEESIALIHQDMFDEFKKELSKIIRKHNLKHKKGLSNGLLTKC